MFLLSLASPATPDPVPALLTELADLPVRWDAERTAGPHVLVGTEDAATALQLMLRACETPGAWRVGLGIGALENPGETSVRALAGPAVRAASAAQRRASTTAEVPVAILAADDRHRATAADAQAVARLVAWQIAARSAGQWRVVRALREHPGLTQHEIAARLGITQQTVSRALKTSGWREESAAHPLLERLLAMIDLTSRAPSGAAPRPRGTVS